MPDVDLSQAQWKKSSLSSGNGECVEIAVLEGTVAVRHSKNPHAGVLTFSLGEWRAFVAGIKLGEFDRLS